MRKSVILLAAGLAAASLGCVAEVGTADPVGANADEELVGFAVGLSDSDAETFSHPAFAGLRIRRARAVVPYDVAERPTTNARRRSFEAWLAGARAHGVEPFVTLYLSREKTTRSGAFLAPDRDEFARAFRAFLRTYPDVRLIAPWNEPNFRGHPLRTPNGRRPFYEPSCPSETMAACGPLAAAMYYRLARRICPTCTLVAGEFAAGDMAYVRAYERYLRSHRPKVWSIHPYTDVNRFQQSGDGRASYTHAFLRELDGRFAHADDGSASHVWLTEVGAYYRRPCEPTHHACDSGRVEACEGGRCRVFGNRSQAQAVRFLTDMPSISGRITRIYYYNFQNACGGGGACPAQDRGVVAPVRAGGPLGYDTADRARGAYRVLASRGGRLAAPDVEDPAEGGGTPEAPPPPADDGGETDPPPPPPPPPASTATPSQCGIRCCDGTLVQVQTGDAAECRAQYTWCSSHDWSLRIRYEGGLVYERGAACTDTAPLPASALTCGVRCCDGTLHQMRTGNATECRAQYTYCQGHGAAQRIRYDGALVYERSGGC